MIIIKTQKSALLKTNRIQINGDDGTSIMVVTEEMGIQTIADYESHERAKEVMDMIEEHIREKHLNNMIINMVNVTQVNFTQMYDVLKSSGHGNEAIFEMPKE